MKLGLFKRHFHKLLSGTLTFTTVESAFVAAWCDIFQCTLFTFVFHVQLMSGTDNADKKKYVTAFSEASCKIKERFASRVKKR